VPVILIVGANRGLGLGLAREMHRRGWQVIGTARQPERAADLKAIPGVRVEALDVNDPDAVDSFAARLGALQLDVLFVNAGVSGPDHRSASKATREEIGALFYTNAVAPIRLARALADLVRPGDGVIAFMSSRLGSIALTSGQHELYSASKAALNMLTRALAAELQGRFTVLSLHPGWVRTDMGGENAPLDVPTSVHGLADVIEQAGGRRDHAFADYQGQPLAW
jgi:NAD(P)-dependent dehydrogenase (short-subunit alcohol dehydrogenase family)